MLYLWSKNRSSKKQHGTLELCSEQTVASTSNSNKKRMELQEMDYQKGHTCVKMRSNSCIRRKKFPKNVRLRQQGYHNKHDNKKGRGSTDVVAFLLQPVVATLVFLPLKTTCHALPGVAWVSQSSLLGNPFIEIRNLIFNTKLDNLLCH